VATKRSRPRVADRRYGQLVRCPWCGATEDRVVDSREVELGEAIRRRRECISCGRRFTTVERPTQAVLWVVKRSGRRESFDRRKVIAGARAACKNRPVEPEQLEALATAVEQTAWSLGPDVQSEQVGLAVLEGLRRLDDVAAVRFASVYKGFEQVDDFAREVGLLNKSAEPDMREVVPNQRHSKHEPGFGSER
jgi:transcriptional repressor NrdR